MTNRRQPRRRGKTETVVNSPYGQELIPLVGKLLLNFGTLELQSHLWIDHLSHDDLLIDVALEMPFARRVDLIHQMIDREKLDAKVKEHAHAAWKAASELSEIRNAVAHNPLVWGWHGPVKDEPDYIGIPVIRKLKGNKKGKVPLVGSDNLKQAVDEVVKVAKDIVVLLEEIVPHRTTLAAQTAPLDGSAA